MNRVALSMSLRMDGWMDGSIFGVEMEMERNYICIYIICLIYLLGSLRLLLSLSGAFIVEVMKIAE